MQAYGTGAMPSFVPCEHGINNKVMCINEREHLWPIAKCIAGLFKQEFWVGFVEISTPTGLSCRLSCSYVTKSLIQ